MNEACRHPLAALQRAALPCSPASRPSPLLAQYTTTIIYLTKPAAITQPFTSHCPLAAVVLELTKPAPISATHIERLLWT